MDLEALNYRLKLQQYEIQLLIARRLARHKRAQMLASGVPMVDPKLKRKMTVEKIAKELYEMILYTGIDNPIVDKIRTRLSALLGNKIIFTYPAGSEGVCLAKEVEYDSNAQQNSQAPQALSQEEQRRGLNVLWGITLKAVDESTL